MPTLDVIVAVVEDDVAMRKSIERLLQASGFDTTAFACGQEFLDSGAASTVNALVLDIHLEGMSGLELQRRLLASGSKFPVIFITAYDDEATREQALCLGCAGYLLKPFESHELTDALKRGLLS
jgi:FixJ family two-component response regulator